MDVDDVVLDIRAHGIALDEMNKRVQCNYCYKAVSGFHRLKCHLGGIGTDVLPCQQVPSNTKEGWKTKLLEKKKGNLSKEAGQLSHPNLPWKRNLPPTQCNGVLKIEELEHTEHQRCSPVGKKRMSNKQDARVVSPPSRKMKAEATVGAPLEDSVSIDAQKCIGRFFYETGISLSAIESPSFQKMVDAIHRSGDIEFSRLVPTLQQLSGTILKDQVKEMQQYEKEIRNSWPHTGCSILLDGWTAGDGRNLVNIVVDCPRGPIYLQSLDISAALTKVDFLQLLLDQVIEDVGVENVVQIVSYCTSICLETLGDRLMKKHKNLFWVVSATHCLELMLERMGELDLVRGILVKAKTITRFIHSSAALLKLMRKFTEGDGLIKPSRNKSAMSFLTLENIVSERENLVGMFTSSEWSSSTWASSLEGRKVADLVVADRSFWNGATMVTKATIPIVTVMSLIYKDHKPLVGVIYETLDQAKETIMEELNGKRAHYIPFWKIIDDIWNNKLHCPLHSAGYYLNPSLFYASDFYPDPEVTSGLASYIVGAGQTKHQELVVKQLDVYREAKGSFHDGCAHSELSSISPEIWWSRYGGQCPELQRVAIRALSQTCDGASKYQLKRSLAEELLKKEGKMNHVEYQRLKDLTYVHYNLQLQNFEPEKAAQEIDSMSDWMVRTEEADAATAAADIPHNDSSSWMDVSGSRDDIATATATNIGSCAGMKSNVKEGSSSVFPKEERE